MIYIGDGLTDVPCMKLVKQNGGKSIAVYMQSKEDTAYRLMAEDRINFFTAADYCETGELFGLVRTILEEMKACNRLETLSIEMKYKAHQE